MNIDISIHPRGKAQHDSIYSAALAASRCTRKIREYVATNAQRGIEQKCRPTARTAPVGDREYWVAEPRYEA